MKLSRKERKVLEQIRGMPQHIIGFKQPSKETKRALIGLILNGSIRQINDREVMQKLHSDDYVTGHFGAAKFNFQLTKKGETI